MQRGRNGQQVEYESLLDHVILPRVLPKIYPYDHEQQEETLLSLLVETVAKSSNSIPSATVRFFQRLKRTHDTRTPESITKEINDLMPGDTFAMFIRRQNTAFMIHMPKEQDNANQINSVTVATFAGNFHPMEIYKHQSDLSVSDSNSNL